MPDEEPGRAVELERRYLTMRAGVSVQRLSVEQKWVKNQVHLDLMDPSPRRLGLCQLRCPPWPPGPPGTGGSLSGIVSAVPGRNGLSSRRAG